MQLLVLPSSLSFSRYFFLFLTRVQSFPDAVFEVELMWRKADRLATAFHRLATDWNLLITAKSHLPVLVVAKTLNSRVRGAFAIVSLLDKIIDD